MELWLTSEDTGTYGRDIGTSLPSLLWKIIKVIPDKCMMRIGMTNPPYILEHLNVRFDNIEIIVMLNFSNNKKKYYRGTWLNVDPEIMIDIFGFDHIFQ